MSERPDLLRIGRVELRIERLVYATVVLMSVLVVYDGWGTQTSFVVSGRVLESQDEIAAEKAASGAVNLIEATFARMVRQVAAHSGQARTCSFSRAQTAGFTSPSR